MSNVIQLAKRPALRCQTELHCREQQFVLVSAIAVDIRD
jgi:hypothetical protein